MKQGHLQIHSENILPIIKKWLYSEKDIFVRELVSNACDALQKVKILKDHGQSIADGAPRIDIRQDKDALTLTFSDNGIGMDAEEVEKYLAQIAFSGAEEFVKAYQSSDPFIGHFGLGFYSAYMVADKVEVESLSCKEGARPVIWRCDGSSTYELDENTSTKTAHGTTITLFLNNDSHEYLEEARLKHILERNCAFLPYPIYLNDTLINDTEPLWVKQASECSKTDYLNFFRKLHPMEREPLFWVHLNVDYPFTMKGILYFPHINKDFDFQKNHMKLFSNRVFVSDDCKDILPEYLSMLRGAIDSPDIPLNVSRSYLQVDKTVRQLGNHISKKVADALIQLYKQEKERFLESWDDIQLIVKLGVLQDEKFYQKIKEILVWKTTQGSWTTIEEYLERNREKVADVVFYTAAEHPDSSLLDLYHNKGYEVLIVAGPVDAALMAFLEKEHKESNVRFRRIDAQADHHILDHGKENTVLDADGKTEAVKIAEFCGQALSRDNLEVQAKSLASETIPSLIVMNEEERRFRDYFMRLTKDSLPDNLAKMTFVVNTNSPLVQAMYQLRETHAELAREIVHQLYDLALLSQKEMDSKTVPEFVRKNTSLIERLALQLSKSNL